MENENVGTGNSSTTIGRSTSANDSLWASGTAGNLWSHPERVSVQEYEDRIEMVYKVTSMVTYTIYPSPPPVVKVFKIVFSCVDGKWNRSEPIYGKIIVAQDEQYEFED